MVASEAVPGSPWASAEVAGSFSRLNVYELHNLARHLAAAGQVEHLHRLLRLADESGRNAWFVARYGIGEFNDYLADLGLGWRLAEEEVQRQLKAGQPATAIAPVYWYAFVSAGFNSSADDVHPALLSALVTGGVWPIAQALAYARRVPEPGPRTEALAAVIPHAGDNFDQLADEAIATARSVEHVLHRARAFASLLPVLDHRRQAALTAETLDLIGAITDAQWRAAVVVAVAPQLSASDAMRALDLVANSEQNAGWLSALSALTARFSDPLVEVALAAPSAPRELADRSFVMRAVPEPVRSEALAETVWCGLDGWRIRALAGSGSRLHQPLLGQALTAAWALDDPVALAWSVAPLLRQLTNGERSANVSALLAHADAYRENAAVVAALTVIAPLLAPEERAAAVDIALDVESLAGVRTVAALAAGFHEPLRSNMFADLLRTMVTDTDEEFAASVLAEVAPYLPEESLAPALRAARRLRSPGPSARALRSLAPRLGGADRDSALRAALSAAHAIPAEEQRAAEFIALASLLPPDLVATVAAAVRSLTSQQLQRQVRAHILPYLPASQLSAELEEAMRQEAERPTLSAGASEIVRIAALAPLLPPTTLTEMFTTAAALDDPEERTQALLSLLPHARAVGLHYPQQSVEDVHSLAMAIPDARHRAAVLTQLAPYLPDERARELYRAAVGDAVTLVQTADLDEEEDPWFETVLSVVMAAPADLLAPLFALVQQLPRDVSRIRWMPDHLIMMEPSGEGGAATSLAPNWGRRAALLGALAMRWPADTVKQVSDVAQEIGDATQQVDALLALRRQQSSLDADAVRASVLAVVRGTVDDHVRAHTLPRLAALPGCIHSAELITEALTIGSVELRTLTLVDIARQHGGAPPPELIAAITATADPAWRAYGRACIFTRMTADEVAATCRDLWLLGNEMWRYQALEAIAPQLSEPLMNETLDRVVAIDEKFYLFPALEAIATSMTGAVLERAYEIGQSAAAEFRLGVTASLAAHLPRRLMPHAIAEIISTQDGRARHHAQRALARLAPRLPAEIRRTALQRARELREPDWRGELIIALIPGVRQADRPRWCEDALAAIRKVDEDWAKASLLTSLYPLLPTDMLASAVSIAHTIGASRHRVSALTAAVAHLPDGDRQNVIDTISETIDNLDDRDRGFALGELSAELPANRRSAAYEAMITIARSAPESDRAWLLQRCTSGDGAELGSRLTIAVADAARTIEDPGHRQETLAACAPHLQRAVRETSIAGWRAVDPHRTTRRRSDVLADLGSLAPVLATLGGPRTTDDLATVVTMVAQAWP